MLAGPPLDACCCAEAPLVHAACLVMQLTNLGDNNGPDLAAMTGVANINYTATQYVYNASSADNCCAACANATDPTLVVNATSNEVASWGYTGAPLP